MTTRHRTAIAAYVAAERHFREDRRGVKTLKQIAEEIGTTKTTRSALATARSQGTVDGVLAVRQRAVGSGATRQGTDGEPIG
jgi:hypothetical protein